MRLDVVVVAIYGVVSAVGGVIGYLKAKSRASLVAGSLAGVFLLVCAYGMSQRHAAASLGSLVIALLLGARFLGTWRRNHRLMPDLLMVLLSAAAILVVSVRLLGK